MGEVCQVHISLFFIQHQSPSVPSFFIHQKQKLQAPYPNSESISLRLATWTWIRYKDYLGFIYSDYENLVSPKVFC